MVEAQMNNSVIAPPKLLDVWIQQQERLKSIQFAQQQSAAIEHMKSIYHHQQQMAAAAIRSTPSAMAPPEIHPHHAFMFNLYYQVC